MSRPRHQDTDRFTAGAGSRALRQVAVAVGALVLLFLLAMLLVALGGSFVASTFSAAAGGILVYIVTVWRSRRTDHLRPQAIAALRGFIDGVEAERRTPAGRRATGADNDSVLDAAERADAAYAKLSQGVDVTAAQLMVELGDRLTAEWAPDAPLTRQAAELAAIGRAVVAEYDATLETMRQRPGIRRARPDLFDRRRDR